MPEALAVDALDAVANDLVGVRDRHCGRHDANRLVVALHHLGRRRQQVALTRHWVSMCTRGSGR
eukprot:350015-Chlamydomonas_euryale.AAC.13